MARNFTDTFIRKLNMECESRSGRCDMSCNRIGWCESCWEEAKGKDVKRKSSGKAVAR